MRVAGFFQVKIEMPQDELGTAFAQVDKFDIDDSVAGWKVGKIIAPGIDESFVWNNLEKFTNDSQNYGVVQDHIDAVMPTDPEVLFYFDLGALCASEPFDHLLRFCPGLIDNRHRSPYDLALL
jgi:hypothetical protein